MSITEVTAYGPQGSGPKRSSTRWIYPTLSYLSLIGGLQVATQYFAHAVGYTPELGSHLYKFYMPWSIVYWGLEWEPVHPVELAQAESLGILTAASGLLLTSIAKMIHTGSIKPAANLHGSARWANRRDIERAGLLPKKASLRDLFSGPSGEQVDSVYVGGWEDSKKRFYYLRHSGPEHVLTYAPTRSGKGVGLVIPTLLSWSQSAVITDLKGELWAMTAGWRKTYAKNRVLRFEPASSSHSVCWNPLDEIRVGTQFEVGDVQNLVSLIVDPDGTGLKSHWEKTAFALLTGVILHALYKARDEGEQATLSRVDFMLSDPDQSVDALWLEMTTYGHLDGQNHPAIGTAGRDMIDRPDDEAGSVLSTAKSFLALYRDPVVAYSVSKSDFLIHDLMNHKDPVSLYIVTQPADKARLKPLVRILISMMVRKLADGMEFERVQPQPGPLDRYLTLFGLKDLPDQEVRTKRNYRHRLLCMIDEFPSLGKLDILQESLAFVAGYGMKFYLICQDINQLKSRESGYGPDESITSNCHVQNAYPPNRLETAEHLSRLTGQTTVVKEQTTTSGSRFSGFHGKSTRSYQEVQRSLLTPDECMRLPGPVKDGQGLIKEAGDMIVTVAGCPAIYGKQPLFFKDPVFSARAAVPPPRQSDRILTSLSASSD